MSNHNAPLPGARGPQRLIIILLALASLGTTLLIALNVLAYRHDANALPPTRLDDAGNKVATDLPLPVLGSLPDFTLIDSSRRPFNAQELRGKVCIVDFIFTRCSGACPVMTSQMAVLQNKLNRRPDWDRIRLVSISVDPQHDQPDVLAQYARLAHADPDHWLFLTGPQHDVWSLIKDGFKLPVFDNPSDIAMPIAHSQKFVLIDPRGRIRGYYDGQTEESCGDLLSDLDKLAQESP